MKKALIITTVSGFVPQFEMSNVRILQEMGYEVHYASNFKNPHYGEDNSRLEGTGIVCHQVDFVRSPFRLIKNVKAYRQLKRLMRNMEVQLVHCHTPMGGVLGRLAAKRYRGKGMKVFYTAHGFHFYHKAPMRNWLCYYPVEWVLSRYTDVLITINEEDSVRARKFPLPSNGCVEKVNGVGIDVASYRNIKVNLETKRQEIGIGKEDYLIVSVGELTKRKNHKVVIQALALMKAECIEKKIRYFICGEGPKRSYLSKLIKKYGLEDIVFLPGYRTDVKEILAVSDCFVFPSRQEGLPVALMEALAVGLPCICSDVRGNRDLVVGRKAVSAKDYAEQISEMLKVRYAASSKIERYELQLVQQKMRDIYARSLKNEYEE